MKAMAKITLILTISIILVFLAMFSFRVFSDPSSSSLPVINAIQAMPSVPMIQATTKLLSVDQSPSDIIVDDSSETVPNQYFVEFDNIKNSNTVTSQNVMSWFGMATVKNPSATVLETYKSLPNTYLMDISSSAELKNIEANPHVIKVYPNRILHVLDNFSNTQILADIVYNASTNRINRFSGDGINVTILDTGIALTNSSIGTNQTQAVGATTASNTTANTFYAVPFTFSQNGYLKSIGVNMQTGGNGNISVALYNNVNGHPGNLIAYSAYNTSTTGWNDLPVASGVYYLSIDSGYTGWLAVQMSSASDKIYYNSSDTSGMKYDFNWNNLTWLAINNTPYLSGYGLNMRATYDLLNYTNPAFVDASINGINGTNVIAWNDFINNYSSPYDDFGHGTHCAGIISAHDSSNQGVAPDVNLLIGKVCTFQGQCYENDVINGINWAVANHTQIVSMSLGTPTTALDGPQIQTIEWATRQGVQFVIASGNAGPNKGSYAANAWGAMSVGAVDSSNLIASFSSGGVVDEGLIKPDISAPGVYINSTVPEMYSYGVSRPTGWEMMSGTSMATPHVAAVSAIYAQAYKNDTGYMPSP